MRITPRSDPTPPTGDGIYRESGRIRRGSYHHMPPVSQHIVEPIRHGLAQRIRREVVGVDFGATLAPQRTGVLEVADEFLLLGIDAHNRPTLGTELVDLLLDVQELAISVGMRRTRQSFDVDMEVILLATKQVG